MRTAKIGPDLRLPWVPAPYPPIKYFWIEKVSLPFPVPSIDKWYLFQIPRLELCLIFSCCKCTAFKLWINHKTGQEIFSTFSQPWNPSVSPFRFFYKPKWPRFLYPLIHFNYWNPNPFIHLKSGKGTRFAIRAKLLRISHYWRYPPPPRFMLALLAISETISLPLSNQHATKLIIFLRWMSRFIYDVRGWWLVLCSFLVF